MNYQEKVLEFQKTAGEDFTKGLTPLREALLKEEIAELEEAIANDDRVEILDALCDIKYVNDGNANLIKEEVDDTWEEDNYYLCEGYSDKVKLNQIKQTFKNLQHYPDITYRVNAYVFDLAYFFNFTLENFKTALDRVHASNMSKFCNTEQEAVESVISYKEQGIDVYSKQVGDKWVIYRLSDNKVLKSKYYHRVDLTDLI